MRSLFAWWTSLLVHSYAQRRRWFLLILRSKYWCCMLNVLKILWLTCIKLYDCTLLYVFKIFLAFFQVLIIHQNDLFGSACFLSWRTCLYRQENSFICGERMGPFWTHSLWISRKVSSELLSCLTKLSTWATV